ncbi:MAG: hypothetical protein JWM09_756 [Francisellaceae bacterium]|nr:hypothetical protein [Francisellaceae bacterium]
MSYIKNLLIKTFLLGGLSYNLSAYANLYPYKADYKLYYKDFHVGTNHQELNTLTNNEYTIKSVSKPRFSLPFSYFEKSQFLLTKNSIFTQSYVFDAKEGPKKKIGKILLNWKTHQYDLSLNDHHQHFTFSNTLFDNLTFIIQLQLDIKHKKKNLNYRLIDKGKLKQYQFKLIKSEKLNTEIGELDTIKLEHYNQTNTRKTVFWVAPKLNYLLVKAQQFRKNKKESEAIIHSYIR